MNRNSLRRIKALVIKEFYQIIRDPSSILISFLLPTLLVIIYGFGVSLDFDHLKLGVIIQDESERAQSLLATLENSPYFDIKTATYQHAFDEDITRGSIRGFIVIPSYFSRFSENDSAPIQVIADGSETNTASLVQNYIRGAWQNWIIQTALETPSKLKAPITIEPRFWYNEELESRNFLIPGSLGIIMTLIGTLLTSLVLAREWERGTMEALISTPITVFELLIGKLIPYYLLGLCSLSICIFVAVFFYDVPLRGSILLLFIVSTAFLFSALGTGLFLSSISKNQFAASQAAIVAAFLPSYMLSGFLFEIASMPYVIQLITYIFPARYFVSSMQTLFLVGNVMSLILFNLIPMIIVGSIFFTLTLKRLKKRVD